MSRSIQSRLTLALTAAAILLSASFGLLLYHLIRHEMIENFDHGLQSKGDAIVSLVSLEPKGVLDFEFNEAAMPEYRDAKRPAYFQIWFNDGRSFAQSKSIGTQSFNFPQTNGRRVSFDNLTLRDGRPGRAVIIAFTPESELPPPAPPEPMVAMIAYARSDLDASVARLFSSLLAVTGLFAAITAISSLLIVRRELRPLRTFADSASKVDAETLNLRLNPPRLPTELRPICDRLNDLLARLETAFAREKRFTSNVAHELRTPIAELRSIAEVALKWPEDPDNTRLALHESHAIAVQMQTLVGTLLSLVRATDERNPANVQSIPLKLFVSDVLEKLAAAASLRPIEVSIPADLIIEADPALLASVLNNLLLNASEYATGDQPILCRTHTADDATILTIENRTDQLIREDLDHFFEPFWRKDVSRTGHSHAGLGLSLVRAYCRLMNIPISARLEGLSLRMVLVLRCTEPSPRT